MTIEEKAKRYDRTIERAKITLDCCGSTSIATKNTIYDILPELKESEDEKIKKEIINYINFAESNNLLRIDDYEKKKGWIAWLEKQSTPQVRTGLEWVNTIDDACDKRYAEEYAHGEYCHEQSFKWGFQEGVDWLEKQGEPTDINPSEFDLRLNKLLKQFETLPKEELASSLSFYLNVVQNDGTYKIDEKQDEQKSSDKVEPKFKVGDWIIHNKNTELANSLMLVTDKVSDGYLCKYRCENWVYSVWIDSNLKIDESLKNQNTYMPSYEEAVEAALKYCLENLI